MSRIIQSLALASSVLAVAGCSSMGGMGGSNASEGSTAQQAALASKAQTVLQQQMSQPNAKRIPNQLIADARCIGVFPSVVKAGFIVGGQHGKGLVACRQQAGGFNTANPAVFSLSSGSIGLQAGAQKTSIVLLFETQQSVDALLQSGVKLGSQIGVTAGPSGYNHAITQPPAPVVAYVMSQKGLYAGIDLSGTKLSFDSAANTDLYGGSATARGVLLGRMPSAGVLTSFTQTLQQFAPTGSAKAGTNGNSNGNEQQQQSQQQSSGGNSTRQNNSQQSTPQNQSGTNSSQSDSSQSGSSNP